MFLTMLLLAAPLSPATTPDPPPVVGTRATVTYDSRLVVADPPPVASSVVIVRGRWVQGPDGLWRFVPGDLPAVGVPVPSPFTNPVPYSHGAGYSTGRIGPTTPTINATAAAPRSTSSPGAGRVRLTHTLAGGAGTFGFINCSSGG